jgi:hypothetical protein
MNAYFLNGPKAGEMMEVHEDTKQITCHVFRDSNCKHQEPSTTTILNYVPIKGREFANMSVWRVKEYKADTHAYFCTQCEVETRLKWERGEMPRWIQRLAEIGKRFK